MAGGVAFVARGNQLDAGLDQRVGNLEIRGAKEAEAAPRAVAGKVRATTDATVGLPFIVLPSLPR